MNEPQQLNHVQEPANLLVAKAYLSRQGDRNNQVLLSERTLQIHHRGKSRAFSLEYIQRIALEHRKLWLPLIGGGIVASLCLLALLHTFTMPYRLLTGAAIGIFAMWWGYRGNMALVVYEQRHHTDFLIPKVEQSLPVFIAFANRFIRRYPLPLQDYCVSLSLPEWQQIQQEGVVVLQQPRQCVAVEEALSQSPGPDHVWAVFEPLRIGARLQWTLQEQVLVAHFQGVLRRDELLRTA